MRQTNPFFHRGPVRDPQYFCNRQREVRQVLEMLRKGQSVSVVGPRRIGKTSLLFQLTTPTILQSYQLAPERPCLVYIDCEGWSGLEPERLCALLLKRIDRALGQAGYEIKLPTLAADSPVSYATIDRAVQAIIAQDIRLILLFDEFQTLSGNPHLDFDFFSFLRGLSATFGVAYVTVSTQPLQTLAYAQMSVLASPFFNIFFPVRLGLFSPGEARSLLAQLAAVGAVEFATGTRQRLFELAGPHPFFLQMAGYYAFELRASQSQPLERADLELVERRFLAEAEPHWRYFWSHLSDQARKQVALLPVATPAEVRQLEKTGLVWRQADQAHYLSAAFQSFIRRQPVEGLLQAPPVTVDVAQRIVLRRGQPVALTPIPFTLLTSLVRRADQVAPHRELEAEIWSGDTFGGDPDRLKKAVQALRRALKEDGVCIESVRGVGYKFVTVQGW